MGTDLTVLSVFVQPELVVAAADTAVFTMKDRQLVAQQSKISFNALIGAIGIGTGMASIAIAADRALAEASDFDALPKLVAKALRRALLDNGAYFDREPHRFLGHSYVIAGWSQSAGRMIAYTFGASTYFAPVLASRFISPEPDDFPEAWFPTMRRDLVNLSSTQCEILEPNLPEAGGGSLTIAELRPNTIAIETIPNFHTGATPSCS